ncbi:glycosyltransferase [Methylobacterium sp. NEAU K]|uniref:glycosyltransferase n=1 Tax=Methylobacterium sp. NEAU K TaxID=3064946 RepID=UPI002736C5F5|nr:glycosyltransferase [Methylobacterium sp. NEAU K]MDP4004397.1 glycosyltransferase [Methylobacterium sp. NEAU K]
MSGGPTDLSTPPVSNKKINVLYLQPGTTVFAGIERVVDTICSEIGKTYKDDFNVDVLLVSEHLNHPPEPRGYTIIRRPVSSRRGLMWAFRSVTREKRYDLVVVPQIEPVVIYWFSCLGLRQRIAMHLHGNPRRESGHLKAKFLFFLLKHLILRRVSSVFGTSPRQLKAFRDDFNCRRPLVWVPNPVRTFQVPGRDDKPAPGIVTFVNVGRYAYQKGQDILIDAFAKLYAHRQDIRLRLVGHGADERALADQIRRLGLSDVVTLEHHPDNPQRVLYASDVFVATSRWEGWSLAICEALRCGLPVVSTDCEFGPSDILVDRRLGRLVPPGDEAALVDAMAYYCAHIAEERSHADFRRNNIDQYSVEKVAKIHAQAIKQAIA